MRNTASRWGLRARQLWARVTHGGFGLSRNTREELIHEIAGAATDIDLTFWLITLLSGAIATLGLLQNSAAVVIGAMLIAPLLGPLTGLALSVAVGNARLFVQTLVSMALITLGITVLAALITLLMPITPLTDQISSRTYPTVLDLFIAISSGAAAALVTGSGNRRLSASIPGVAVAVALVPPLGAAGYALGDGPQWDLVANSLLLFWTNLAGIALSGLLVFLLLGFGTDRLNASLEDWHGQGRSVGVARWIGPLPGLQQVAFRSALRRVIATLLFVGITSIPLIHAFERLVADYWLDRALQEAETTLEAQDGAFVVERQVEDGPNTRSAVLTTISRQEIPQSVIDRASREARSLAHAPLTISVVQRVIADRADYEKAASEAARSVMANTASTASGGELSARLRDAASALALPPGMAVLRTRLAATDQGGPQVALTLLYADRPPPSTDALAIVSQQLAKELQVERERVSVGVVRLGAIGIPGTPAAQGLSADREPPTPAQLADQAEALLRRFTTVAAIVAPGARGDAIATRLTDRGIAASRITRRPLARDAALCLAVGDAPYCAAPPAAPATPSADGDTAAKTPAKAAADTDA